ncbi:MAG: N-acetylglucosamine-6-phosphate deacetylase, partial [Bacteroidales bacterium]|nr:N-acetylglucosamine-6-phosphate deacetylase [Bacteroidales bacterium]
MVAAFTNAIIYTGTEVVTGKALLVEDEKISGIIDRELIPSGTRIIDCGGDCIAPGLIDLQIAGGGGYLFSDRPSAQAMNGMADSIIKSGTTGFLIALPSNSHEVYLEAIRVLKENP